ncbi:MAG: hypothetical protein IKG93_04655 [Clostridiales bacterium]|nr:hypothetical protein [Clostridiales bacterium]
MKNPGKRIACAMCMLLMLQTAACSKKTEQETSGSATDSSASSYSETSESTEGNASGSEDTSSSSESETLPSDSGNYCETGSPKDVEQTFDLSFSDDLKVYDYGKKTVNVYRAKFADYIELSEPFFNEWIGDAVKVGQLGYLVNWSTGGSFDYSPILKNWEDLQNYDGIPVEFLKFQCSDHDNIRRNIQNVDMITLNGIENGEDIAKECGIDVNSPILCWEYSVVDFPVEDAVKSFYDVPVDAELFSKDTVKYAQVRAQYVDGIPVVFGDCDGFFECTFEWPDVIEPSRRACSLNRFYPNYSIVNPSDTCRFDVDTQKLTTTEVIKKDLPVVAPEDCLDGIAEAIKYQPSAISDGQSYNGAWGKDIEVYCMELTYIVLDPKPAYDYTDESEESRISHVMYLVPAWKAYYMCTDPESNLIGHGSLVINAATGESLFSSTIAQGTNLELYPYLHREG